ncbi:MAG: hypothetical protein IPJ08_20025 [Burkholderiales bacterium]|nr:hypothetical protein [Burkholderiales bacterium]
MHSSSKLSNHRPRQQGGSAPKSTNRVLKTLSPEQPGTMRLLRRYGDALVCVRYREDPQRAQRYTTVELIVDRRPFRPRGDPQVAVQIDYAEARLRQRAQELGAEWNPTKRAWVMPFSVAERLKLLDRIV